MTKRVLLTGASGFIGRHCVAPLLLAGYEVHAVSSKSVPQDQIGVHWHQANLLEESQIPSLLSRVQPTHLLHLAWYVVPGELTRSPENLRWVQASLELLRQFAEHGGTRAMIAGSGYEYDWEYGHCSETDTPTDPSTFYGVCKNALRQLVVGYSDLVGLSSVWARIFFLYGPHEHPDRLVSSAIRSLLRGVPARCSHGNQIRDYLYVQDVADALAALLESRALGVVNIGSGQPVTLKDIVMTIGATLQRPDLIRLGALPARENDAALVVADTHRLMKEVGWRPRYDLNTGLERTMEWWREQMQNGGGTGA